MAESSKAPDRSSLTADEQQLLQAVGYADHNRSATAILVDQQLRLTTSELEGVEIMPIQQALRRYDWVQDLMFKLIKPDENAVLRQAAERVSAALGHFVYVHDGVKARLPIQTFTLMEVPQERQFTHNITVIGKQADVEWISGAAVPNNVHAGHHVSISETYLREGARCRSLSIEHWGKNMQVDSYARSEVAAGAELISNEIMLAPLRHHLSDSKTWLGANAVCNEQMIVYAPTGSERSVASEVYLTAAGARSESIARMVCAGGNIVNRSLLVGQAGDTSGFLGCDGLQLSDQGSILASPALHACNAGARLSHEASVGMIDTDKINYLMASGLSEDRARDLIIQGFLNLKEDYLPTSMRDQVAQMIAAAKAGGM